PPWLPGRQSKFESRSLPGLRFHPYPAALSFDDLLADRQADSAAGIFSPGMQALEDRKDHVRMLGINADAVVGHREHPFLACLAGTDMNLRRIRSVELNGVSNQI